MSRAFNDFLDLDADGDSKSDTGIVRPAQSASAPASEQPAPLCPPVTIPVPPQADASQRAEGAPFTFPARTASTGLQLSSADTRDREARAREQDWRRAEEDAALCREFLRLTNDENHSLRSAARLLGRYPGWFSGESSRLTAFLRGGVAALLPAPRVAPAKLDLTEQIEALGWFIPAARFFNLKCNSAADRGSVTEAIRRTISLPALPCGWTHGLGAQLLKTIGLKDLPTCPPELREAIIERERRGKALVPQRIAREIVINKSVIRYARNSRDWDLTNNCAPASARRFNSASALGNVRERMQAGDWFSADDATPGIAVCVPCGTADRPEVMTPCAAKFGVLLGRFQWLAFVDCAYDFALGFDYVVRPRGSYRAEDILHGMKTVVRSHGIPHQGFQFEGGTFNSHAVRNAIKALRCQHWRTYSPHQKVVEILFNKAWTRLAVQFPHADMGRFRGENAENCAVYEACKAGHKDPRRYFPTLALVVRVFQEVLAEHNRTLVNSRNYGTWIPEEVWARQTTARPLRQISAGGDWMFAPFAFERTVKGVLVGGKVPMFEDFSVPFDFTRPDLHLYDGAKVRCHFDPRDPQCIATLVLLENCNGRKAGELIGPARLVNETAGYLRLAMGWAEDDAQAGRVARQKAAAYVRRESRALGVGGRTLYSSSEEHDGLGTVNKIERAEATTGREDSQTPAPAPRLGASAVNDADADAEAERREENRRAIEDFEQRNRRDLLLA